MENYKFFQYFVNRNEALVEDAAKVVHWKNPYPKMPPTITEYRLIYC